MLLLGFELGNSRNPNNNGPSRPAAHVGGGGSSYTGYPQQGHYPQQGQGNNNYRPNDNYGGGGGDRRQDNNNSGRNGGKGGNGRNGRNKNRPRCQICSYWGHTAGDCRNRFNPEFVINNNSRSGNSASTNSNNNPASWVMDSGATDHLTSQLDRLHFHTPYGGKDQVQVANGAGLSISHIGHSTLAGSSLCLKNILHVPNISKDLLSVYRLVSDNDVFAEFHRHFFCVKDKATRRVLLHPNLFPSSVCLNSAAVMVFL